MVNRDLISGMAVILDTFAKLSRTELANTICELFSWVQVKNLARSVLSLAAKQCRMIGSTVAVVAWSSWKPWWMENNTTGHFTRPPIGYMWEKPRAGSRMDRQNQHMGNASAIAVQNTDFRKGQPDRQGPFGRDISNCGNY